MRGEAGSLLVKLQPSEIVAVRTMRRGQLSAAARRRETLLIHAILG